MLVRAPANFSGEDVVGWIDFDIIIIIDHKHKGTCEEDNVTQSIMIDFAYVYFERSWYNNSTT